MSMTIITKYKSASPQGKAFVWLSIIVGGVFIAVYASQLTMILSLDPRSGTCLHDSMMQPICRHPWSSSIEWSLMIMIVFGWPLLITWLVVGLMAARRLKAPKNQHYPD